MFLYSGGYFNKREFLGEIEYQGCVQVTEDPNDPFYAFHAWGCTSKCTLLRNVNLNSQYNKSANV